MAKLIAALNSLGPQPLALILILIGGISIVVFHFAKVDIKPGGDIIVAGITILTAQAVGQRVSTGDHPSVPAVEPQTPAQKG